MIKANFWRKNTRNNWT